MTIYQALIAIFLCKFFAPSSLHAPASGACKRWLAPMMDGCLFTRPHTMTTSIDQFIESFLTAVDFQEAVEVTPDTVLKDLPEWDSLAALGVIVMFDMDFGKTITGEALKQSRTIADLYKLLG